MRKRTIANLRKNGFFYCVAAREVDRVIFDNDGHWNPLEVARTVKLAYGDLIEGLSAMSDRKVANAILRTMGEVPVQNPCAELDCRKCPYWIALRTGKIKPRIETAYRRRVG